MVFTLPVVVFFAETFVVTLSTVRTIFVARGWKTLAPLLGFFEVSIWLFAISQVIQNLTSPGCFLAFAGGFSLGNFLGVLIEQKLALGNVVVHITTREDPADLIKSLMAGGYGVTAFDAQGATGPVQVVFTVIKRKELENIVSIIKRFDSKAFYSVNDLQSAAEGIRPAPKRRARGIVPSPLLDMGQMAIALGDLCPQPSAAPLQEVPVEKRA
jgi:uncharacterized protein YebE (UPF0316 family)